MGQRLSMVFKKKNNGVVEPPLVDDVKNDDAVIEKDNSE